jgi:uncharacterized membrane protein YGL010W
MPVRMLTIRWFLKFVGYGIERRRIFSDDQDQDNFIERFG